MRGRLAHQILVHHTPWMRNQGKRTFYLTTSTNTHKHDHKQPMLLTHSLTHSLTTHSLTTYSLSHSPITYSPHSPLTTLTHLTHIKPQSTSFTDRSIILMICADVLPTRFSFATCPAQTLPQPLLTRVERLGVIYTHYCMLFDIQW